MVFGKYEKDTTYFKTIFICLPFLYYWSDYCLNSLDLNKYLALIILSLDSHIYGYLIHLTPDGPVLVIQDTYMKSTSNTTQQGYIQEDRIFTVIMSGSILPVYLTVTNSVLFISYYA